MAADVAGHALELLPEVFAVCRLDPLTPFPEWAERAAFCSIARTTAELSIVCPERLVPRDVRHDRGWRCLKLVGPFALDLTGVLASVLQPLADAGVSIFAVSTFDTDYVLVRSARVEQAVAALRAAGHRVG